MGLLMYSGCVLTYAFAQALDVAQTLISGALGGILATGFNAPFDVVKSRFQSQLPTSISGNTPILPSRHHLLTYAQHYTGQPLKYRYTIQSLITIYREEGAKALYKGFAPKSIRMAVGGGVCMAAFELTCYFLPDPSHVLHKQRA